MEGVEKMTQKPSAGSIRRYLEEEEVAECEAALQRFKERGMSLPKKTALTPEEHSIAIAQAKLNGCGEEDVQAISGDTDSLRFLLEQAKMMTGKDNDTVFAKTTGTRQDNGQIDYDRSEITMRNAEKRDMFDVCEIYRYYVELPGDLTSFEEEAPPVEEMVRRFENITNTGNFPFLLAEIRGQIIGYAYANFYKPRSAYRFSAENSIYIHPDHTGKGLGSLLMKELLERLKRRGIRQVVAVIGTNDDNPASYQMHLKFGFTQAALFKKIGFKFNKWIDRVHMQLDLMGGDDDTT